MGLRLVLNRVRSGIRPLKQTFLVFEILTSGNLALGDLVAQRFCVAKSSLRPIAEGIPVLMSGIGRRSLAVKIFDNLVGRLQICERNSESESGGPLRAIPGLVGWGDELYSRV